MWSFSLKSLFREYGRQFIRHVAARHPLKTVRAVRLSGTLDLSGDMAEVPDEHGGLCVNSERTIVGVGFCMKPMSPGCPSGRANHDCRYFEQQLCREKSAVPMPCRQCFIRDMGEMTLKAGSAFYIMTSARDILFDVFKPALDEGKFVSGLFLVCRYSIQPFTVGMLASGIQGWIFPFEKGDCRDYKTWLNADNGIKDEQTEIGKPAEQEIRKLIESFAEEKRLPSVGFKKCGNVLYPEQNRKLPCIIS